MSLHPSQAPPLWLAATAAAALLLASLRRRRHHAAFPAAARPAAPSIPSPTAPSSTAPPAWLREKLRKKNRKRTKRERQRQRRQANEDGADADPDAARALRSALVGGGVDEGGVGNGGGVSVAEATTEEWLAAAVAALPALRSRPGLAAKATAVLFSWRRRLDKASWKRLFKTGGREGREEGSRERVLKELNECAPILVCLMDIVAQWKGGGEREGGEDREGEEGAQGPKPTTRERITIVDLCSGFGILSMFLSELLPSDKLEAIVLVDKMWPPHNQLHPSSTQMAWAHLRAPGWPVPLFRRKANIKSGRELRHLDKYVFDRAAATGPVILVGIHLCGALSNRAVHMFNTRPEVGLLILKPCCLPGRRAEQQELEWRLGTHHFTALDLYRERTEEGRDEGAPGKGQGTGVEKGRTGVKKGKGGHEVLRSGSRFQEWCCHMHQGIDTTGSTASIGRSVGVGACGRISDKQDVFVIGRRRPFENAEVDMLTGMPL